ncbi:hypothetical protein MAR_006272, partial [Mya arenaria]
FGYINIKCKHLSESDKVFTYITYKFSNTLSEIRSKSLPKATEFILKHHLFRMQNQKPLILVRRNTEIKRYHIWTYARPFLIQLSELIVHGQTKT